MSALSQDTYLNQTTPLSVIGSGSQISTFTDLFATNAVIVNLDAFQISTVYLEVEEINASTISTLVLDANFANVSSISSIYGEFDSLTVSSISSIFADIRDLACSSISTLGIYLDGNLLTTASGAGAELLLNGVPIATTQNISSLAEWSFDPAISTLNMNNNNIIAAKDIFADSLTALSTSVKGSYVSTLSSGFITADSISTAAAQVSSIQAYSISASNLNVINLVAVSSFTSSISSVVINVDDLQVSSINNSIYPPPASQTVSTFQDLFTSTLSVSSINGSIFPQPSAGVVSTFTDLYTSSIQTSTVVFGANTLTTNPSNQLTYNGTVVTTGDNASQWSRYAALQTVSMNAQTLNDTRTITGNGANLDINVTGITGQTSLLALKAENGLQGQVNITAGSGDLNNGGGLVNIRAEGGAPAVSGLYGHINLTATYGQVGLVTPVYSGGLIELNATSGPGGGGSSAIKLSAAGINSYAGYLGSIGSLAGYNYIYGTLGVNITCDVIPSIVPNTAGTVYLFGRTGIELGSDTYVSNIYPYWDLGTLPAPNLKLAGRTIGVYKSYVDISGASQIAFDPDGNKQLLGAEVITLTDAAQITISSSTGVAGDVLGKDALNNLRWIPGGAGGVVSTFTTAQVSSLTVSTILAAPGVPWIDIQANTSVNGIVSSTALEVKASQISSINTSPADILSVTGNLIVSNFVSSLQTFTDDLRVSSINNAAYPPSATVSPNLIVSTLTAFESVSTPVIHVSSIIGLSSINGAVYPPPGGSVPPDLIVSTLTAFESVSTPVVYTSSIIGLSSINGAVYPPAVSAGSFITLGGASVACTSLGEINALATAGQDINITSGSNLRLNSAGGVANAIFMNGGLTVDYTGKVLEFAPNPGTSAIEGQIVGLSTINGSVYPPPFSGAISSITNSSSGFVEITATGGITASAVPGQLIDITTDDILVLNGLSQVTINNGITVDSTGHKLTFDLGAGSAVVGELINVSTINGSPVNNVVYQATYYKTTAQNLVSGNTDITFDGTGAWNNTGGYITHTNGTTDFTVVQTGLYQLEFNAVILLNNGTWTTTNNKTINIDITRPSIPEQALVTTSALQGSQNYGQSICGTIYLVAGDVINLRLGNVYTGGTPTPPQAQGLQNTFDLNTFFTWRFISLGTATAYQNPPPVIQTAGTTALTATNANTTYILNAGTTQNFTTAGLTAAAGTVWYVKNAQPAGGSGNDIAVQANGTAITGSTATLHQATNTANTGAQIIYWNGTTLSMY